MKTALRAAILALVLAATASSAAAQQPYMPPPEPLPMGVAYVYQPGNPYWYRVIAPNPSPYPFGSVTPIYGRYSWDYTAYYPNSGMGYTQSPIPVGVTSYYYPQPTVYGYGRLPGRVWYGFGW